MLNNVIIVIHFTILLLTVYQYLKQLYTVAPASIILHPNTVQLLRCGVKSDNFNVLLFNFE